MVYRFWFSRGEQVENPDKGCDALTGDCGTVQANNGIFA
jgi:hypothetical protein